MPEGAGGLLLAAEERLRVVPEGRGALRAEADTVELAAGLGVVAVDGLEGEAGYAEAVVDGRGDGYLLLVGHVGGGQGEQGAAGGVVGQPQGVDEQVGLLAAEDVAAVLLAEHGRVAVDVEVVVLQLEGEAYLFGEGVEGFGVGLGGSGEHGAEAGRAGQQDGGLEAYHLEVFLFADIRAALEVDVVLLSLAYLAGRAQEEAHGLGGVGAVGAGHVLGGHDEHGVAREYGRVVVPGLVHGGASVAHVGAIHEVVVQERVVVIHLYAHGGGHGPAGVAGAVEFVGHEQEGGAQSLAAAVKHVAYGFVEALGRLRVTDGL